MRIPAQQPLLARVSLHHLGCCSKRQRTRGPVTMLVAVALLLLKLHKIGALACYSTLDQQRALVDELITQRS